MTGYRMPKVAVKLIVTAAVEVQVVAKQRRKWLMRDCRVQRDDEH